jgi:hypothetical protein
MSIYPERIAESRAAHRRSLAHLPVAEKLELLDKLRDRALELRAAASRRKAAQLREPSPEYRAEPKQD